MQTDAQTTLIEEVYQIVDDFRVAYEHAASDFLRGTASLDTIQKLVSELGAAHHRWVGLGARGGCLGFYQMPVGPHSSK